MSKFCTKCGATLDDNATFCTSCGTPVTGAPAANAAAPAGNAGAAAAGGANTFDQLKEKSMQAINDFKANPKKNTYIGIAAVGLVVLILLIVIIAAVAGGGGGYKGALNNYFNGICDKDGKKFLAANLPDNAVKYLRKEEDMEKDEIITAYKSSAKYIYSRLEDDFGKNLKITYKITDKEKLDKDDLEDIEDEYIDRCDGDYKFKVTDGYELELELTIKGKDDKESGIEATAIVVKVNGQWIVDDIDCDDYYI